jgi:UDP-2-acetamido-2-deoxy-ribo-hexuluronate aminotransferase
MNIPFVDLKSQYKYLKSDIDRRIQAVLDHGQYILGPEVREFEERLEDFTGAAHAIGVSNGTDALLVALIAFGVGPGKAVFLPSFTYTATAEVVVLLGATPVFVEVDERSFNIDPEDLEARIISARDGGLEPAIIIPVDLFGLPADYDVIGIIAARHGLKVISDAAQSIGARQHDRKVGTLAPITCTSFFPAKPLGCFGDGGAVFTDDDDLARVMRSIHVHGTGEQKYDVVRMGLNARLDTIQAAVLLAKISVFADELERRNELAAIYDNALSNLAVTPLIPQSTYSSWAQYTIQIDSRDEVAKFLKENGIPTAIYYPLPMHLQPAFRQYGQGQGSLPVSECLSKKVLSLPMHPYMNSDMAQFICEKTVAAINFQSI